MSLADPGVEELWMNGEYVAWEDATVHALAHGANYGSGVFEGTRCYETDRGPAIFRLDAHLERLEDSARVLDIEFDYPTDQLAEVTRELIRREGLDAGYIRHSVSYGLGTLGLDPTGLPLNTLVAAWPWGTYLGEEALERGTDVMLSPWRRLHSSQFPTQAKTLGIYVISTLAKQDATSKGYDEAIVLDMDGNVAEGSGENLFLVRDGTIYTPGLDSSILEGVTRRSLIQVARDLGYEVVEKRITTGELFTADEVFFCGTAVEVTPVRSVDDREIGTGRRGPVTEEIQREFFATAQGEREAYHGWLEFL